MRRSIIIFIFIIFLVSNALAKIWIVDNNPNRPSDFKNFQAATVTAVNGDTLYVHGSSVNYESLISNGELYNLISFCLTTFSES